LISSLYQLPSIDSSHPYTPSTLSTLRSFPSFSLMPLTRDVPHDIGRAWHTLERREQARVFYRQNARHAREGNGHPAPEFMFYSAEHARADSNKAKNRYRDVVAYDRTGVRFDDERYLNANVVVDAAGRWWVAAQVSSEGRRLGGTSWPPATNAIHTIASDGLRQC
jgi:hypothetical protein